VFPASSHSLFVALGAAFLALSVSAGQTIADDDHWPTVAAVRNRGGRVEMSYHQRVMTTKVVLCDREGWKGGDADLQRLSALRNLRTLVLRTSRLADDSLAHLAPLRELESLDLWGTAISDRGIRHLAQMTSLKRVNLSGTALTNDGCRHLAQLKQLEELEALDTFIDEQGVSALRQMLPAVRVRFSTRLSDEDINAIRELIAKTEEMRKSPLLGIGPAEGGGAMVKTGSVHGPLWGGGDWFRLKKIDGKWEIVAKGFWIS
jgi:hypothetical protein